MATPFDPDVHRVALTDQNGNPLPIAFDPDANGGDGGFVVLEVDDVKEIDVKEIAGSSVFDHGEQDVASAGTSEQLPNNNCREATITAKKDNTGTIYIGGSTVSNASYGAYLDAGDVFTIAVENTDLIYIDADENGDGIVFCYA